MKRPLIFFLVICLLGIGGYLWYANARTYPVSYGVHFSKSQAMWLGLDWRQSYRAILDDLHPPYLRLVSFWNEIEPKRGRYDFVDLDWQMAEARRRGVKVTLVVGQKQPRWPECHIPEWAMNQGVGSKDEFFGYVKRVVERYRKHPALEIWQVENEPFIRFSFGECDAYHPEWVVDEIALVRSLDPDHKILVTDSGELSSWRRAIRAGDYFGTTVYRAVRRSSGWVWTYDWLPAIAYRWKAKILGRDMSTVFVSELQAEPWLAEGNPKDVPNEDQMKTMSPARFKKNIDYVRHIGVPRAYLWGTEWWYMMKAKKSDSRYWDMARESMSR